MNYVVREPWDLPQGALTPEGVWGGGRPAVTRRDAMRAIGGLVLGSSFVGVPGCGKVPDAEIDAAGAIEDAPPELKGPYPAPRDGRFSYGRPESRRRSVAEFTNFFEFSTGKSNWRLVGPFKPLPWTLTVDGLCSAPRTFGIEEILKRFKFEERAYRHRCVEAWAMCVPWTGFPLRELLKAVEPQPAAKFVRFESLHRPSETPGSRATPTYPWPYVEGLSMGEAINELALIVTGIYGAPLPKQHGAPLRLVVPWKYGYKCAKSIVRITLTREQPRTFWPALAPDEYDFDALVNPDVPHPRWSQKRERMLGTGEVFPTVKYNGYGDFVAKLYES